MTWSPLVSIPTVVFFAIAWVALVVIAWRRSRSPRPWIPGVRRLLLGAVLAVALAGPAVMEEREDLSSNVEIVIAVDRTGSMAAEDFDGGPRLEGVRRDIVALVEATPSARYSVVSWDGSARIELPLTTDSSAVISYAELLHQEISEFSSGSSMDRPVELLRSSLSASAELRPGNARYLIVISDGESTATDSPSDPAIWGSIAEYIDGGAVLGYGTAEGGNMQQYRVGEGATGEYIEDGGALAVSRADEATLASMAEHLGVPFIMNPSEADVAAIGADIMTQSQSVAIASRNNTALNYIVWPCGIAAALLVGWECIAFAGVASEWRRRHAL